MDYKYLICTYKATDCLKIQIEIFKRLGSLDKLVIYENSPASFTDNRTFLKSNGIAYIDNPGGKHAQTVDRALKELDCRYVVLLDEDCFLRYDIESSLEIVKTFGIRLVGEISASRGGYNLKPRVSPWCCIIDREWVEKKGIDFVNIEKVYNSGSSRFYLDDKNEMSNYGVKYDVGATFFEDIAEHHGMISSWSDIFINKDKLYFHVEGASWRPESDICKLMNQNPEATRLFFEKNQVQNIENLKGQLGIV